MFSIWLIGATNVGKSTLFNRLIWQYRAIVTDIAGTTIDIVAHRTQMDDIGTTIFYDSPGLSDFEEERSFIEKIIHTSDLLLFIIDDNVGITSKEQFIYKSILAAGKKNKTIFIVNKLDLTQKIDDEDLALSDYYDLGFDNMIWVSAKKSRNISELHDKILDFYQKNKQNISFSVEELKPRKNITSIAIVGKPNVGKSTLLNTLAGSEIAKVEDKLGTTRDYLVWTISYWKKEYDVYDTAGIRKKWKIHGIEKIAYDKINAMLEYVRPVVIFMIDTETGITHRDMTLLEEINRLALPMVFAVNKADLISPQQEKSIVVQLQDYLQFARYLPILPVSAKTGKGLDNIFKMIDAAHLEAERRIDTHELINAIHSDFVTRPPRFPKNKVCKIMYATQVDIKAPTFLIFVNHKNRVNFAFTKWLENTIRSHFWFVGTPIVIRFKWRDEMSKRDKKEQKIEDES